MALLPFKMSLPVIHIWKKAPFIRFLIPLIAGIILQWHLNISPGFLWPLFIVSSFITLAFFVLPFFERYKLSAINGFSITLIFIAIGGLLSWYKNIEHSKNWFGNNYNNETAVLVTLQEHPVEKTKSFKANA